MATISGLLFREKVAERNAREKKTLRKIVDETLPHTKDAQLVGMF